MARGPSGGLNCKSHFQKHTAQYVAVSPIETNVAPHFFLPGGLRVRIPDPDRTRCRRAGAYCIFWSKTHIPLPPKKRFSPSRYTAISTQHATFSCIFLFLFPFSFFLEFPSFLLFFHFSSIFSLLYNTVPDPTVVHTAFFDNLDTFANILPHRMCLKGLANKPEVS